MRIVLRCVLTLVLVAAPVALSRAQDKPDQPKPDSTKKDDAPKGPEAQFTKQIIDFLKSELDLSEEQQTKVASIMEDAMKEAMKMMFKRMGEDAPDREQMRKDQEAMREKIIAKIREVLDEPQKREFETLVQDFEQRAGRFERANGTPGGDAALWLEGEHPSRASLLAHAEAALILSQDEHKAIFPRIEKVVDARIALREFTRDQRKELAQAAHGGAKNDEIQERFHVLRRKEAELREALDKASEELRELVTVDQEARLVAIGILD